MTKVKINKKEYPVYFGIGAVRLFARKRKLNKLSEVDKLLSKINYTDMSFDDLDILTDLILAGIEFGCRTENVKFDITATDIEMLYDTNPDEFANSLNAYFESLPVEAKGEKK